MNVADTVQPAVDLLDSLGPWGPLVGLLVALVGPKLLPLVARLGPVAVAAYTLVLGMLKRKAPATPAVEPTPAHPLLQNILTIIKAKALAKRSYLEPDDALRFYLADLLNGRENDAAIDSIPQPFVTEAVVTPAPSAGG